ncbi:hypothetical protein [Paenibacillus eucommiae]|uniref:DNA-directed RNA polymerase subunit RPC12/RpoP n=1 Tax=Paenibacillus eucommiae TaxID=1355755 RepID=A0ABS4IXI6_9BACL|nr:hypothetical protein [Paenibacillus eucommiae]MBP1992303.1 DNA-directed RNA polymerase subunit RPC12/RpoP [Paenibacillus eucommiae]
MRDDKVSKWIQAAKILGKDPIEKVACPECGQGELESTDVDSHLDSVNFERYMHCPICLKRNILRMKRG